MFGIHITEKKRKISIVLAILLIGILFSGCINTPAEENGSEEKEYEYPKTITVASFYIDNFDNETIEDEEISKVLVDIFSRYDIVAVNGMKSPNGRNIMKLVDEINAEKDENGKPYNYSYELSDPVFRNGSDRKQNVFVYNRDTVYVASVPRVYLEPYGDDFEWEPYMVAFRAHTGSIDTAIIVHHANPNDVQNEIDALHPAVDLVKEVYAGQTNITVLGNLWADKPYYDSETPSPLKGDDYTWIIGEDEKTTIDGVHSYDKIIVTKNMEKYMTDNFGVFNFSEEYGLNETQTAAISLHYPVYIEFYVYPYGK